MKALKAIALLSFAILLGVGLAICFVIGCVSSAMGAVARGEEWP